MDRKPNWAEVALAVLGVLALIKFIVTGQYP